MSPRSLAVVVTLLALVGGVGGPARAAEPDAPPLEVDVDYQLSGGYAVPEGTGIVVRDRLDDPAGVYDICYVNGFQTQPGELRWWKRHHPGLLLRRDGRLVRDPGWRDEVLLDTRTRDRRQRLTRVVGRWFERCADDGFDAVEPDNLDSFTRSRGLLSRESNLRLVASYVDRAHAAGLAIAQKNLAGLSGKRAKRIGFDFAVAEDCQVWSECARYRKAYGRHVLEIEYSDEGKETFRTACRRRGDLWAIVYRDRDLRRPSQKGYRHDAC